MPSARSKCAGQADHQGICAVDDNTATFWLADSSSGAVTVTIQFAQPTDIGVLVFHAGSATDSQFSFHARPRRVRLAVTGSTAPPVELELKDQSEAQSLSVDLRKVSSVELRILDTFPASQGGRDTIALREVEFKARR